MIVISHMKEFYVTIDWSKWGAPTVLLALAGLVLAWARPAMVSLLHYLLRYDQGKARETLLVVIRSEDGKLKIRAYMDDLLAHRWADIDLAKKTALENKDILAQVKFTQEAQAVSLKEIEVNIERLPGLADALDRMSQSMETFSERMENVADFMSRADERERIRDRYAHGELPERRREQREPNPHTRQEDNR